MPPPPYHHSDHQASVPTNNLWVGNLTNDVTEADLALLFDKYGALDIVIKNSSRNYAFVCFGGVDEAKAARDALLGAELRGFSLKIEFAKPAKQSKSLWVGGISACVTKEKLEEQFVRYGELQDFKFLRDRNTAFVDYVRVEDATEALKNLNGLRIGGSQIRVDYLRSQPTRRNVQSLGVSKSDGQLSNVLRVSYPSSSLMDEQMLHNALILLGEIESIRSDPARNSFFVEFRSVEEAKLAKDGLEGRLFNDPRILITYSVGELEPNKDQYGFHSRIKGPNMLLNDIPFRPGPIDSFNQNHPVPNSFPGHPLPDMPRKPLGPKGSFEPLLQGPEFVNRKRLSPTPGVLSSPLSTAKLSDRHVSGSWDVFGVSQLQRESKRPRTGAPVSIQGMTYGPVDVRAGHKGNGQGHPELDYKWRGFIAKGGSHVCYARCVLVQEDFAFELPEVINCSARTGLDMLAKHLGDAAGFNVIYFMPDSVEDFATYTEFVRYLGTKSRAGVAKFDDGATLFLVPPSDFVTHVLKISGPERLYGVVLKFPQHAPGNVSELPQLGLQNYISQPMILPRTDSIVMPKEERILQVEYNKAYHKNTYSPSKSLGPSTSNSLTEHSVQPSSTAATSRAGITLTPELIATLASLLPTKLNSSGAQTESGSSQIRPMLTPAERDEGYSQEWSHGQSKVLEQGGQQLNQALHQYTFQSQIPPQLHYSAVSHTNSGSAHGLSKNTQIQDLEVNMIQHGSNPARSTSNFPSPTPSEQFAVSPQVNQRYRQLENPQYTQNGYDQGTNGFGLNTSSVRQPNTTSATSSPQIHGTIVSNRHRTMTGENSGLEPQNQVQQLHSSHSRAVQGITEVEVDKKELYQSTLQLAANLLRQLHQPQPGSGAAQQSGNR